MSLLHNMMSTDNQDVVCDTQELQVRNQSLGLILILVVRILILMKELGRLPFPLNLGKVEMSKSQQIRFLELIYDNKSVFSLCDEDLGFCNCLKHTIPTTMDKPVYLPHRTIPVQLQAEVRRCLDTWLKQGII